MWAAVTHRVLPYRLQALDSAIPKVLIITGDDDNLVAPENSEDLAHNMPHAEYVKWEQTGHAINGQWFKRFNAILDKTFKEGRELSN